MERMLHEKRRPILVEFDPPRNESPEAFIGGAQALYEAGADVITIADCPIGKASIDACMLAAKLKREYGIETLPHMACRDRNLNAAKPHAGKVHRGFAGPGQAEPLFPLRGAERERTEFR